MKLILFTLTIFLLHNVSAFSQINNNVDPTLELKQGRNQGDILLVKNGIIQDTVGKFRYEILLLDFHITNTKEVRYIVVDYRMIYWLVSAKLESGSWNIKKEVIHGLLIEPYFVPRPVFRFSSKGELQKQNKKTQEFYNFEVPKYSHSPELTLPTGNN